MKVADVARTVGITPHAVRYYVAVGLVQPGRHAVNGYREFAPPDLARLAFIRKAQGLGFTLNEIAHIFRDSTTSGVPCPFVCEVVRRRLQETANSVDEVLALQDRLRRALKHWRHLPGQAPDGKAICAFIEEAGATAPAVPADTGPLERSERR
jgi:MerR family transcriptional regulator, Zn(II)-responsive regulator of zntA